MCFILQNSINDLIITLFLNILYLTFLDFFNTKASRESFALTSFRSFATNLPASAVTLNSFVKDENLLTSSPNGEQEFPS